MEWFWHVLLICVVVIPVTIMWLAVIIEIATRHDLRWWQRVAWILLALVLPLIGCLIYLIYTWATAGRRAPATALPRFGGQSSNALDAEADLSSLDRSPSAIQSSDDTRKASATNHEPKHGA